MTAEQEPPKVLGPKDYGKMGGRPKERLPDDPMERRSLREALRLHRSAVRSEKEARANDDLNLALEYAKEARQAHALVAKIRGDLNKLAGTSSEDERILQEHKSLASASEHQIAEQCASFLALYNLRHPDRPKVVRASGKPGRFQATG